MGYGDFRTPDGLGPTYQALGSLVPNMLKSYTGGLGLFRDNQQREALAGLGPGADPAAVAEAMRGIGNMDGYLGAMRFNELQQDRGLQRQKLDLEIRSLLQGQQERAAAGQALQGLFGGGQQPQPQARPMAGGGDPAAAISSIESGGRYDALGPQTRTGDRAYGKYQVMGANIPQWTRQYLGREMTPQEFLANPQAQDAVFQGEFGRLSAKHGPQGAARAWFAGEGGMNDMGRKDVLGTTVQAYGDKFARAYGGGAQQPAAPVQMAQAQTGQANDASKFQSMQAQQLERLAIDPSIAKFYPGVKSMAEAELKRREAINAPTEKERTARAAGLRPGTPEYRDFMLGKKTDDLPGGYERAPEGGMRPIKGGPADPATITSLATAKAQAEKQGNIPAELASRIGLGNQFLDQDLPKINTIIDGISKAGYFESGKFRTEILSGYGAGGDVNRRMLTGLDALRRNLTGAGMGQGEAVEYANRYMPAARDTAAQMKEKIKGLESDLKATRDAALAGRNIKDVALTGRASATSRPAAGEQRRTSSGVIWSVE